MGSASVATEDGASPGVHRLPGASLRTIFIPVERIATRPARPKVTLVTEGTYPYYWGGVSTWCHALVHGLPDVDFTVLSIVSDPNRRPLFEVPSGLPVVTVPMWGIRQSYEIGSARPDAVRLVRRPSRVSSSTVEEEFLPVFGAFLSCLWSEEADLAALADSIGRLHGVFLTLGFDVLMQAPQTWEMFRSISVEAFPPAAAAAGYPDAPLAVSDVARGFQIVMRWLQPLGLVFPPTDVVHAAMAGMCSLVAVAIKQEQDASFFLTEHGIYLREALLSESRSTGSLFLKLLSLRFALRVTQLSYRLADQISPCCDDHKRWEFRLGASPGRVKTLYYGVDPSVFRPASRPPDRPPTVVWVGRIDPLKDVETLLRTAALVREARPEVRFRLFGSAPPGNEEYYASCLDLHRELGLGDAVVFEGFTRSPAEAFNQGDVAVLTSISEGFPYSTLEAMLCGRPVVATGVGGLGEQVGDCGVIVEPRNAEEIAGALLQVLDDSGTLERLGSCARARAERAFSLDVFLERHRDAYRRLAARGEGVHVDTPVVDPAVDGPACSERSSAVADPQPVEDELEDSLLGRVPMPVDVLEVTAALESTGVTAGIARRYGAADTFALADRVLDGVRARRTVRPRAYDPDLDTGRPRRSRSPVAFLAGLVPAVVATIVLMRWAGLGGDAEAAILGMLSGLVVSNGLLQGLTPRTSLYIGCENWAGVRRAVVSFWLASSAGIVSLAAAGFAVGEIWDLGHATSRSAFLVAFCGIAVFWTSTGGLFALGRQERVAGAVVFGLAIGALASALGGSSGGGFAVSIAVGYAGALIVVIADTARLFRRTDARRQPLLGVPAPWLLLREAGPFIGFGALVMVVLLSPHALVLFESGGGLSNPRVFQFELAANLALLPLLASAPYADRLVERFWAQVTRLEVASPATDPHGFSIRMRRSAAAYSQRLASFLCLSTAVFLFVAEVTLAEIGDRLPSVGVVDREAFEITVAIASIAYLLLGWGLLNGGWSSSLGAPGLACAAAAAGALGTVVAGVVLVGAAPLEMEVVATAVGAGVFAAMSLGARRAVMARAAHRLAIRM